MSMGFQYRFGWGIPVHGSSVFIDATSRLLQTYPININTCNDKKNLNIKILNVIA